ncbi:hypothetical protein LNTAR_16553 [Lentisphaera araneosa HTCC2155]|uniref:Uncharacterized protein n=1 Tax=Lentisphaera araneosa HTCC2155 TaxID=313628 RepID=A6DQC5_9BACT|nr:hypothetical protein [Lentisphaera araneosa]EDM26176.1 hypothetical protein LNTAR_16553 [Lentisphaera araneosa HTCC2155]
MNEKTIETMKENGNPTMNANAKPVSIKYNIAMTFAFMAYIIVLAPLTEADSPKLLIEDLGVTNLFVALLAIVLCLIISVFISMLITRSLWNRLISRLSGWQEINLAEAYALSLFFGTFVTMV